MRKKAKSQLSPDELKVRYIKYRQRVLPEQLESARLRYTHLCREAKRMGMAELLAESELHL